MFRLWDVPSAVWAYGFLRAAAFGLPAATGTGGVGLGAVVVLALFVGLARGSRVAWVALVALDVMSFALLVLATPQLAEAPLLVHICAGLALVTLLLPSTRRHAASPRARGA